MKVLKVNHILSLFQSFACSELAEIYAARDRAAGLAADALDEDRSGPLHELQALLRAAVAVALVSQLPTAVFVESGILWRAKVDAHRRLQAVSDQPAEADPFSGLSFNLLAYSVRDFEATLVAAAALAPFQLRAQHHFASALAAASDVDMPELKEWAGGSRFEGLSARFASLLDGEKWAVKLPKAAAAPLPTPDIAAAVPLPAPNVAAAAPLPTLQSSEATVAGFLTAAQAVRDAYGPKQGPTFIVIDEASPLYPLLNEDEICGKVAIRSADNIRFLNIRTLFEALQGKPPPDLMLAPIAAVMRTACEKRELPEDAFRATVRRMADRFAFAVPTPGGP